MTSIREWARRAHRLVKPSPDEAVYLVSAAGQPNYGDELITRGWLEYLAQRLPDVDVWLDCPEPGRAAHLFRHAHPRLRTTNTLWQLAQLPAEAGIPGADVIERAVKDLGSPKIDAGLTALREMRSLHLLGGGYISSLWPRHLGVMIGALAVNRHFDVPLFATGQGWIPMDESDAAWVSSNIANFTFAEARDVRTATTFGIDNGVDDAYLSLLDPPVVLDEADVPEVMLLVQGDLGDNLGRGDALGVLEHFIEAYAADARIGVAEAIAPEDSWLLDGIRAIRPGAEFFSFGRIWNEGFPARRGQRWLTTRFHAHLVAAASGAEGTAISVVPGYYDVKHELLLENGTGWSFARSIADFASRMPAPHAAPDFPKRSVDFARRKRALADKLYSRG